MGHSLAHLTLATFAAFVSAAEPPSVPVQPEYLIKAKFIGTLAEYVSWPPNSSIENPARPLVLGVVGESPFGSYLDSLYFNKKIKGKEVRILYSLALKDLASCDILFICESETSLLPQILKNVSGRPILTISDSPDFVRRGVMINLVYENERVRFEVNRLALKGSSMDLSSHVLKLAKLILD